MSLSREIYRLGFEYSPIILVGGIAESIPGKMLPIIALTQAASLALSLVQGDIGAVTDLDRYFARFYPLPGSTLLSQQVGQYPFANQVIAANATIQQPLSVSLKMICPVQTKGGYFSKLLTMTALQQVLAKHNALGGLYTVATPSFLYLNTLLLDIRDISPGNTKQAQTEWQFDFTQPLVTGTDAANVLNSLMAKMDAGLPTGDNPTWSGLATNVGSSVSGAVSSVVAAAQNLVGTSLAAPISVVPGV